MATEGLWTLFIRKTTRVNIRYEVTYTIQSCVTKIEKKQGKDLKIRLKKKKSTGESKVCVCGKHNLLLPLVYRGIP